MTALHSAVVSSRGSRRPELERQCTHARLHAYVSSQVRQIGASRPRLELVDELHRKVSRAEIVDRGVPEAEQRGVDPAAQDVEHVLHAGLAVGRQAPEVRPADHHRAGAERQRLDDVAAAPDAAVEHDLDLVADRLDDRRPAPGSSPASRRGCCRRGWRPRSR